MEKISTFFLVLALIVSLCHCHLASVVQSSGESRQPFNNFVDRVARGPSIRSNEDDPADLSSAMGLLGGLKTPAYQMRFRPTKFSQYYHNAPNSMASQQLAPLRMQGPTDPADPSDMDDLEINDSTLSKEAPTFTPFIGARALSNMGKFFEHLRENLVAMQVGGSSEIGQPERRRMSSEENDSADGNQDFNSSPEARALAQPIRWTPPATGNFRERNSLYLTPSGERAGIIGGNNRKHQTFIQPMTADEALLRKANNYNPSWLWTNMGLGRR